MLAKKKSFKKPFFIVHVIQKTGIKLHLVQKMVLLRNSRKWDQIRLDQFKAGRGIQEEKAGWTQMMLSTKDLPSTKSQYQ